MAGPPIPPSLDHLAARPFSFYPAVVNVEHNEWLFKKTTWSEILVVNCKSGAEVWIPRRFIGEVSRIDDPVLIVGLTRELEYKGGMVCPYQRRVLQMPMAVGAPASSTPAAEGAGPASVVGIRLEPATDKRMFRFIGIALAATILVGIVAMNLLRVGAFRQRVVFTGKDQLYLDLSGRDDYFGVVQKLGKPATDRWQSESGELQYRALGYPDRNYTVILMGADRRTAAYIGTVDDHWRPIHSVELRSGGTTASLLRELSRF
jgi:hypothetical protein